ncbi:MAG: ABC-type nitrate/sulfonate/bicarbonate transport system ATPase component [Candidatus Scalindua rubra]|uniref:ABC-type nitrate/sulfonate/bicarbonate transport system ATPase component n=1 Tax=Candidatus Scalindua rubra TaxID=1872076 RepID=A0A1E3XAJ7_9BACT|nr:MAG: ABC-type nitrate/sulfonate/bicarbonate transport system ATPase component [Candidatus Scalindua rubra]
MNHIVIENLCKYFGDSGNRVDVLRNINLSVRRGEFLTLFGPNGCGKTTLVNIVAGIENYDSGILKINETHSDPGTANPGVSYVFQDYRETLMPWLNAGENICFPLLLQGVNKIYRHSKLNDLLERFGVTIKPKAKIYTLSGGQAQLVSILRALITNPEILILDEPFSALDYQTCLSLYDKILDIWRRAGVTVLFISHEIDEALYLGDRTVFLSRRPATILDILQNEMPRPRTLDMMGSPEFASLKKKAIDIFQGEIIRGNTVNQK